MVVLHFEFSNVLSVNKGSPCALVTFTVLAGYAIKLNGVKPYIYTIATD